MPKNRKLLSVGTPLRLSTLRTLLSTVETDRPEECIVKHQVGQLIIEEPLPTFPEPGDEADGDDPRAGLPTKP